jgi:hypothetical protein
MTVVTPPFVLEEGIPLRSRVRVIPLLSLASFPGKFARQSD